MTTISPYFQRAFSSLDPEFIQKLFLHHQKERWVVHVDTRYSHRHLPTCLCCSSLQHQASQVYVPFSISGVIFGISSIPNDKSVNLQPWCAPFTDVEVPMC